MAFWRFSLAFYGRAGAAAALLALQDRAGRDVNLMLFALWLGAVRGCALDRAGLVAAEAAVAASAAAVAELRALRRRLRGTGNPLLEALRRRVAALELAGEQGVQCRLAAVAAAAPAGPAPDRLTLAASNLALYLGADNDGPDGAVLRATLASLMRRGDG